MPLLAGFLLLAACPHNTFAQPVISTYAGNGAASFGGDGGAATLAQLNTPSGVAIDRAGNLYVTDFSNNRIRKIDSFGVITTYAGTGTAGSLGDGGPATAAQIFGPRGIAVDTSGNVYFSDYGNNKIRKITTGGIISTIAGTGGFGFSGDGGPATAAQLNFAWGLTVDDTGNVYIADQINCRIRKINTSGTIKTIGGNGFAFFSGDGGPAISAGIQYPMGVAIDPTGNIYVADNGDNRIRKITPAGTISTLAGSAVYGFSGDGGPSTLAKLYYPQGVATDNAGNIYIADLNNNRIRRIDPSGTINTLTGTGTAGFSGDGGPPFFAEINQATGVAVDASGRVFIADNNNNRVRVIHVVSHAPYFVRGHIQTATFCLSEEIGIDSLLSVYDIDTGQTETWSLILPTTHGAVAAAYDTLSDGDTLHTSGLLYSPGGYTGVDSFKVRVTDGGYSDTTTIYVTVVAPPYAGIITGMDTLCPGDTLMLSDTTAGGAWSVANTTIAAILSPGTTLGLTPGLDTVLYTVTNYCGVAIAMQPVFVRSDCIDAVANTGEPANGGLSIFPNPGNDAFIIDLRTPHHEPVTYQISDLMGRQIREIGSYTNQATTLSFNLPAGVYLLSAATPGGHWVTRFIAN